MQELMFTTLATSGNMLNTGLIARWGRQLTVCTCLETPMKTVLYLKQSGSLMHPLAVGGTFAPALLQPVAQIVHQTSAEGWPSGQWEGGSTVWQAV